MPRFILPPRGLLSPSSDHDPLRYYYHPLVGLLFRKRLQIGLDLLPSRFSRLLEVGYGSGLLLPTLAQLTDDLCGLDRTPPSPEIFERLAQLGCHPHTLVAADVESVPFPDEHFDGVIAFSIFEHLRTEALERAADEVARILRPGGTLLIGCPAVHPLMNAGFAAIGFPNIAQHHVSTIFEVLHACAPRFRRIATATLPRLPRALGDTALSLALYSAVRLERR